MQRRKPTLIGDILRKAVNNDDILAKGMQEAKIVDSWRQVAGDNIANYTESLYIRNQKLYVELSSQVAKQEFYNNRYNIINELNAKAGKKLVKFIQII